MTNPNSSRISAAARAALRMPTWLVAGLVLALAGLPMGAAQAAPPAGTPIGNAASATYTDGSGVSRTVTSNVVTTIVQQVASLTLVQDLAKTAPPGGQVSYPATLTNTGNGSDTFSLATSEPGSPGFNFTSVSLYEDANNDGIPDDLSSPITSTGPLAAGAVFNFVAVGNVPASASPGATNVLRITATSTFDAGQSAFVDDTTTITGNAVINVSKAMSATSGPPGSGPHTITLTYTNTGNATATGVTLRDVIPANFTYVAGSGRWSVTGATVLTDADAADAQGTPPDTIVYDFGVTAAGQVTAVINRIAPGASGTLTFQVTVDAGIPPGTINNTASYLYNDGAGNVGPFNTNTVAFLVDQVAGVTVTGDTVASATQGATVSFTNQVTNTGNGTDTFDITLEGSTFPAGTGFTLFQSDGATPLLDTNGNGIPDTGPVAAGASTNVVLRAALPPAATGGPFTVDKRARSVFDTAVTDTGTDTLTVIATNSVDLTNDAALPGAPGAGAGPEASPVTTNSVNPGATTRFTLFVNNTSTVSDTFDLAASTDASFATITLPTGWTVTFRDAALTVITNTGPVAPGGSMQVFADVTVPAGQAATPSPGQSLYFRALSPTSGASDRKHDAVIVNTVRSLNLIPNNSGQVFPGGTVVYSHTLTNAGNVTENDGAPSTVTLTTADSAAGFSSLVYRDANGDGILDPSDPLILSPADLGAIPPGGSVLLLVRVTAPPGAPIGAANVTTLTATTTGGAVNGAAEPPPAAATDTSTVVAGNVVLSKRQAIDADCNGVEDTAFGAADINALPGQCVRYEVTATNTGSQDATSVVVSDSTPANTTYVAPPGAATTVGSVASEPAGGGTGTVTVNVGTLAPGVSAVITFGVQVEP